MANIKVELSHVLIDGQPVTFAAPCDCTEITGLKVVYPGGSRVFTFRDAHGNALTGLGNLFSKGAYVKAILDVSSGSAYLQNADTNAYLEGRFDGLTAVQVGALPSSGGELSGNIAFNKQDPRIHIAAGQTKIGIVAGKDDENWYSSGASLFVYQNDCINNKGFFVLNTGNIEGSQHSLYGKPNGDLSWGNRLVNPPMLPGAEYPTIERFNGKIVYAKLIDFGSLPNTDFKSVAHGVSNIEHFVSVTASARNGGSVVYIPSTTGATYDSYTGWVQLTWAVGATDSWVGIMTNADRTSWTAKVLIKYTKTTG